MDECYHDFEYSPLSRKEEWKVGDKQTKITNVFLCRKCFKVHYETFLKDVDINE